MVFLQDHFNKKKNSAEGGYTIVELLVGVALFTSIVMATSAALLSVVASHRKTIALRSSVDNLSAAVESITRGIKTGHSYHCQISAPVSNAETPGDCSGGGSLIAFEKQDGARGNAADQIVYYYDAAGKRILRSQNGGATYLPVTAPSVSIDYVRFFVVGTALDPDMVQPRVTVVIRGSAGIDLRARSFFNVQTTVSQRRPDISS